MENMNYIVLSVLSFVLVLAAGHGIIKKIRQNRLEQSIHSNIERTLTIYSDHIKDLEKRIKDLDRYCEKLQKENAELKNVHQTLLSDNTYLRDKLNAEKKW
jgi:hypothetical protein